MAGEKETRNYTLKIGKIAEPIVVALGSQRKAALLVRDALRKQAINADVVLISKPKVID